MIYTTTALNTAATENEAPFLTTEQVTIIKQTIDIGYWDDHNGGAKEPRKHNTFILYIHESGKQYICPIFKGTVCSINPLEMNKDGEVHLSTFSVGGTVDYRGQTPDANTYGRTYQITIHE